MKKTFIFGLMAAMLGLCACSSDDDFSGNTQKGMVLRATVEQKAETRATISDAWQFAFASNDKVSVTNPTISGNYYTFTNNGSEFTCEDAQTTAEPATWYAYFPSNEISLVGQSGTKDDVANKYALAGATAESTTGKDGLNIIMSPKVAILVIKNQKGEININVKNSATTWVKGLAANADGFTVTDDTEQQNLLNVSATGTYYIAVPAGIQLAIKDGGNNIKSTSTSGLVAGKYYELTIVRPIRGKAYATGPNCDVNWVQLWEGGPKFAEYNIGAENNKAEDYGGYYNWGVSEVQTSANCDNYQSGTDALSGETDTATALWGSNWRMPTSAELSNAEGGLFFECNCVWTENYNKTGVNGLLCKGKEGTAYADNSVFLPAAGYCRSDNVSYQSDHGRYWSSTPVGSYSANHLYFDSSNQGVNYRYRYFGYSVRAVLNETK